MMRDRRHHLITLGQLFSAVALLSAVIALVWAVSQIGREFVSGGTTPVATMSTLPGSAGGTGVSVLSAVDLPLFGRRAQALAIPLASRTTKLDLKLRGTIPGADPNAGLAIIEAGGRQRHYRTGEEIGDPAQATLHEVHRDHVVLAREGGYESLPLLEARAAAGSTSASRTATLPGATTTLGNAPLPIDTRALAQSIKAMPHFDSTGNQQGFRLQVGPQYGPLLRQLGLRSTDVITEVDGVPLSDPRRALELTAKLRNSNQFDVKLRRDGVDKTLTIDTATIRNRLQQ